MGGVFLNNNFSYAIFPLNLISDEKYRTLSSGEKLLYILLLNRTNYSRKNLKKFYDDKNGLFVYYPNEQIKSHLNCSSGTAKKMLKNLEKAELIKKEYQKNGLPIKIYVTDLRGSAKKPTSNTVSFDIAKAEQQACENRLTFGEKKNKPRKRNY